MNLRKSFLGLALAGALASLAACDTAEERAEKHYQAGLELLAKGDVERALVEFRNVFQLNGMHKEARLAYAKTERERGNLSEAYSQYLRLIEQYPDNLEGQRALAEIAAQTGDWDETERRVTAALKLAPEDPGSLAVKAVLDYGRASKANDAAGMDAAAVRVRALLEKLPDSLLLNGILIDTQLRARDFDAALATIAKAISIAPAEKGLYALRLTTLAAKGDDAGVEAGLLDMVRVFPDDPTVGKAILRWYASRGENDKAKAFLRGRIAEGGSDQTPILELVAFIAGHDGLQPALDEIDGWIAKGSDTIAIRATRAGLRFDLGQTADAIAEMRAVLKDAQPSDDSRRAMIGLAQMLIGTGDQAGGRALIEQVLVEDASNVEALKIKAQWLILEDKAGEAINLLRRALDQSPQDASVMTLMAQAYERDGSRELMRDMLGLAVDASGRAPDESIRYARLLLSEGSYVPAERILVDALRLAPGNPAVLGTLGQVYVAMKDWLRAGDVARELEATGDPEARTTAAGLRATALAGQQKTDEALKTLQDLADKGEGGFATQVAIVRAQIAEGRTDEARDYAARLLASNPGDRGFRFLDAYVREATGDAAGAEAAYRAILADDPANDQVWMALFRVLATAPDRQDEAASVLDQALAAVPASPELRWAKAGILERRGDIDGAIALYEGLYAENSANMIVANNLASLLSASRTDQASLDRAELIARRLKGSRVPAYQDTYGWIAFLRGNYADAITELEKAAEGLPEDPSVQYHLGMAYLKVDRRTAALEQFRKVIGMTGADDPRPFAKAARDEAARLVGTGEKVEE